MMCCRFGSWVDIRKIGNVDEGVVERGEDTGNAKYKLACANGQFWFSCQILDFDIPSRTCGPREMFSWAGRVTFFGGMMGGDLAVEGLTMFNSTVARVRDANIVVCGRQAS